MWYVIHAHDVIGLYIFKTAHEQRVTLNGVPSRIMLNGYLFLIVVANNLQEFQSKQDGATCYTTIETIALQLGTMFLVYFF